MRLKKLVKIDSRFEKSVNLSLDLYVQDKIDGYIPTRSSVNILDSYLSEVSEFGGNRATVLIGPYGKGKSHLLLVLLAILSQTCPISTISKLVQRISLVNPSAANHINDILSTQGQFLPVLINANSSTSLNQAFMRGLSTALARDGLHDVVPDNYYTESIKMIRTWKDSFPDTHKAFLSRIGKKKSDSFIKLLENYDEDALSFFRDVYPELTSGGVFNPMIDSEVVSVYQSVNRTLREKHGYAGIYIIFDEFSKYIEGHSTKGFADDMKVLQDMCELCNASKDEQLHLTCVAHKSIKAYGASLPVKVLNAFKGVEGRLKEVYFVVSSQNNYELISDAITKTDLFDQWAKGNERYTFIVNEAYSLKFFSSLFTQADFEEIVGKGCFPLTPVAAMLLLNLSERIAQNERTVFTYIASKSSAGLAQHVEASQNDDYVGVDSIYDYFIPLFKDEVQTGIHHEWLKADYALSQVTDEIEVAVIKCISVIRMINIVDDIAATGNYITLAIGRSREEVDGALNRLCEKKLIEFKTRTGAYEFKNNVGVDVEQAISDCIKKRFAKADACRALAEISKEQYILPKKHNQTYCITRYFNFTYMTFAQYMNLKGTSYLTWPNWPDGVVIMITPSDDIDQAAVERHTKEIADPCLVVCLPRKHTDFDEKCRRYLAVESLRNDSSFIDNNLVIKKELENLSEEVTAELNDHLNITYYPLDVVYTCNGMTPVGPKGLNRVISDICDEAYSATPRINHELINRHDITAQVARARNALLNDMLSGKDLSKHETGSSAESTIFRAVMSHTKSDLNVKQIKNELDQFIAQCVNKKTQFASIIEKLTSAPYGMRRGVLPFYILDCLLRLENLPVIYLNKKEVTLDVETVINIVNRPKDYSLYVELETAQKSEYIHNLEALFSEYSDYCRDVDKKNQLARISCMMQSWYRSLPQTAKTFSTPDIEGQNISAIVSFRKLFSDLYLNPHDILFERIPAIFKTESLVDVVANVKKTKADIDSHIQRVRGIAVDIIRTSFGFDSGSDLQQNLLVWYENLPDVAKNSVLSSRAEALLEYTKSVDSSDEDEIASKIVRKTTGMFIEDWKPDFGQKFHENLTEAVTEILSKKESSKDSAKKILLATQEGSPVERFYDFDPENLSVTANFFKSALDDILEEYEGVLENNEKVGVLMEAIKTLMG